jgi:polysaccharide pyruvyl transferase WcaK-like protein
MDIGTLNDVRTTDSVVVGLNISGLLFSGGYTRDNMFGLQTDYQGIIESVVDYLMTDNRTLILLVPHVFTPDWPEEDDPSACRQMYEKLNEKYPGRIFITQGTYNQNEIKYVIGLCDFFLGSRMHSCIAALSQSIPAVGIAYSKKFRGVFDTVGLGRCVAEVYQCDKEKLLSIVKAAFEDRVQIKEQLNNVLPDVKANLLNMFDAVNL